MDLWTTEDFLDAVITALDGTHSDTLDADVTVQQTRLAVEGLGHVDIVFRRGEVTESRRLTLLTVYKGPPVHSKGRSI